MQTVDNYRSILRQELVERCQRNPKYSLRAFAKQLKVTPSRLSDVINGKKGLSRAAAMQISSILGMNKIEKNYFCDLVESVDARSKAVRDAAKQRLIQNKIESHSHNLTVDVFKIISDWYHFSILQLIKLPHFSQDPNWIAQALDLKPIQVKDALERLERIELIEIIDGKIKITEEHVSSPDGIPSDALKKFNEQLLKKAIEAIYLQNIDERDFCSVTMPFAKEDVPKAKIRIRKFIAKLCEEFSNSKNVDSVYCFSTQLINHTAKLTNANLN